MFSTRKTPQRRFLFDFHWITSDSNRVTQEMGDKISTILNWDMMCIADSYFLFFVICMNSLELRTIKLWYYRRIHSWTPCQGKRVPQYVFKLYFPEVKTTTWIFSFNVWKTTACAPSQCTLVDLGKVQKIIMLHPAWQVIVEKRLVWCFQTLE